MSPTLKIFHNPNYAILACRRAHSIPKCDKGAKLPAFRERCFEPNFCHLSFEERKTISRMRGQKFSQSEIARHLGCDRVTTSQESKATTGMIVGSLMPMA
ncbi:MAG: helix-turn-helix domain-containing protein [Roseibium aggregatum]